MTHSHDAKPAQRLQQARVVKIDRKVAMWVVFCASMIALVSFSLLFIHAAYRNSWW
ncbi:hypothetical protein [Magnetovibrio sp.]|uniref:hypothetical protein n=1 Tax=Magnetovibrio sp. TaxID=2024836 RepID=UPI002F94C810